jgi:heme-degrading monooxygenase HmoA
VITTSSVVVELIGDSMAERMGRVASFHLIREPAWKSPLALARLGTDRLRLPRVDGLAFWRLLGTGSGDSTGGGADLARTAVFAVWNDEADLDRFVTAHPIAERWGRAQEAWHVRLRGLGGHGRWRGVDPLEGLERGDRTGAVAIITRADVRRTAWKAFGAASRVVDAELHTAPGLLDVVGVGEAPVGRLATFSLWESLAAARHFAYEMPDHVEVVRRTRDERWYGEELFARFEPYGSQGTWNGRDPLTGR